MRSPWADEFGSLLASASASLVLCAPYVGRGPCERIGAHLRAVQPGFRLDLLTDLSLDNILSGATDAAALAGLLRTWPSAELRFLPSLHAKVYVADERCAVVTSANLTDAGMSRNFEYGALFDDPPTVRAIRDDVLRYAALGSPMGLARLEALATAATELRPVARAADRSFRAELRREFKRRLKEIDEDLLRARVAGRSAHAIFGDAVLYLLGERPATTAGLNAAVRRIHPDLCDDSVDRVIDGRHFGKKWKHAVRTAQAHLQRRGEIYRDGDLWRLVKHRSVGNAGR